MKQAISTDGYISIMGIDYGITDYVVLTTGERCEIEYDIVGDPYFKLNELEYKLSDFIRL